MSGENKMCDKKHHKMSWKRKLVRLIHNIFITCVDVMPTAISTKFNLESRHDKLVKIGGRLNQERRNNETNDVAKKLFI